jgi:hypothetical protein
MDFIALAAETDPRRLLRVLTDVLGDDDGFGPTVGDSISNMAEQPQSPQQPQSYYGDESAAGTSDKPFLSKVAEAELYLLATNFLLYVAMVLITTMVAKIYFPESLVRNENPQRGAARNYSYRMATELLKKEQAEEDEDYYGSERELDEDDDDDLEEVLDSDDDEGEGLLSTQSHKGHATIPRRMSFLEFQQESLTKTQVLQRLVFCSLMLNITFVMWGALQVRRL